MKGCVTFFLLLSSHLLRLCPHDEEDIRCFSVVHKVPDDDSVRGVELNVAAHVVVGLLGQRPGAAGWKRVKQLEVN